MLRRDRAFDGRFVTGVLTTGIYCRPSCGARHPKRENVRFFRDGNGARSIGLRACKRCLPDDVARDETAVLKAVEKICSSTRLPALSSLASYVGYSPAHFLRIFKRATGLSPRIFAKAVRHERAIAHLALEKKIIDAVYESGWVTPSRFYADMSTRLGMTPTAWRNGGSGETIGWLKADTKLGLLLVAHTQSGICFVLPAAGYGEMMRRFSNAQIARSSSLWKARLLRAIAKANHATPGTPIPPEAQWAIFCEMLRKAFREDPARS